MKRTFLPIGFRSGRLSVIQADSKNDNQGHAMVFCRCDCGKETRVRSLRIAKRETKHCGCQSGKNPKPKIHGFGNTKFYFIWRDMIRRCENKTHPSARYYALAGIRVCDRWKDIRKFAEDMGVPADGLTLDRVDNSKGYSKENCRWADRTTQQENRRCTIWLTIAGERISLAAASRKFGIKYGTLSARIKRGYSHELAVTTKLWNEI